MVKLKDVIATFLNDMASARVEADVESLRIAEIYSRDELLKNMPIPRMRLVNFTLTMPLAIDKLDEKQIDESRKPLTTEVVSSNTLKTLANVLSPKGFNLSEVNIREVKSLLKIRLEALAKNKPWIMTQVKPLSAEIVMLLEPFLSKVTAEHLDSDELKKANDELRVDLRTTLFNARPPLPNLDVIVNTVSLKNISDKEKLVHITLNVDETGLEWAVYESSTGETRERLVPE